jgi:hypothetical protein
LAAALPADALVRERLAVLCLALLAASGRELAGVAEGDALERLAALVDGRG